MKMKAYVVEKPHALFVLQDVHLDEPQAGELRVRIVASGVCHTDMNTQAGDMPFPLPGIMGHEGAGVVEQCGAGVTGFEVGDHVIIGWPYCGTCRNCKRGEHRYCENIGRCLCSGCRDDGSSAYHRDNGVNVFGHFFGQSSFAEYAIVQAAQVVKVDKSLPLAMLGPLACGITTGAGAVFNTACPKPGESIVIYGAGAVGLAAVMAAKNSPATTIVAVDLHDSRLDMAKEFGATHVINPKNCPDVVAAIKDACGGMADYAIDCTGVISVIEQAAEVVGMLGMLILVGGAPANARVSFDHLRALWGQRIVGVLGGSTTSEELIPALLKLYQQGRFPFDRLIEYFPFDELDRAIEAAHTGSVIKPVLLLDKAYR